MNKRTSTYDPRLGVLHLVIPVTPSGNTILSRAWSQNHWLTQHKRDIQQAVWGSIVHALGYIPSARGERWAQCATLAIVRCSRSRRRLDDDNVVIGCKYARDALVKCGIVPDDNPQRLRMTYPVEDRPVGQWGEWHGPHTHLILQRVAKFGSPQTTSETMREALERIASGDVSPAIDYARGVLEAINLEVDDGKSE